MTGVNLTPAVKLRLLLGAKIRFAKAELLAPPKAPQKIKTRSGGNKIESDSFSKN